MRSWRYLPTALVTAVLLTVAGLAAVAQTSLAQNASGTPDAMGTPGTMEHNHPAHIHSGTCDTLGDVVYPLDNLTSADETGTPTAGMDASPMADMIGTPMAAMGEVVAESTTTIEASLDDIFATPHAINVHESVENVQNYIACGDLTGSTEEGQLHIELNELNDSGYEGMAVIEDNDDGTLTVTVMLTHTEDGMATPSA